MRCRPALLQAPAVRHGRPRPGYGPVLSLRAPGIDRAPGDKPGSGRFVGELIGDEHGTGMGVSYLARTYGHGHRAERQSVFTPEGYSR
jgi:hypothetical protein